MVNLKVARRQHLLRKCFPRAVVFDKLLLERLRERLASVYSPGLDFAGVPKAVNTNLATGLSGHSVPRHGYGDARLFHIPGNAGRVVVTHVIQVFRRALAVLNQVVDKRACAFRGHLIAEREDSGINIFSGHSATHGTQGVGTEARLATPEGLEPSTWRLEVACSIQLSYGAATRFARRFERAGIPAIFL